MTLAKGTRIAHFEILSLLGKGGMGEVYLAEDNRLQRKVALKLLPATFTHEATRLRRFEQEARATSALNHPNILTVYDIGYHEGVPFIITELLEGEELRAQLDQGALPARRALDYTQQIVAGLAAAHEKGIVHRDLKPENLFITTDGRVKILDFGLAKLRPQPIGPVDSQVATQQKITDPGTVMGTVGYMSPEQVRGLETDHRADIFSFGVILYEMLSGERPFGGDSAIEVMNAILKEEPPELCETNAKVSPPLEKLVRHCLEKKPERRFQSASDLGFALEALSSVGYARALAGESRSEAASISVDASPSPPARARAYPGLRVGLGWIVAGVLALVLVAFGIAYFRRPAPDAETVRLAVTPPDKATSFDWPTISPDGHTLAFVARIDGKAQLWVRPLNSTIAKPLTENGNRPFWSPDSQSIGFFQGSKLKKIALDGGTAETLCDADVPSSSGGAWNREGVILFAPRQAGIKRISANGGAITDVTTIDRSRGEVNHLSPVFLPDGRRFLFYSANSDSAKSGISLTSLDGGEPRQLLTTDNRTIGVASNPSAQDEGWIVYSRQGALLAQAFDFRRNQLMEKRAQLAGQVRLDLFGVAKFSVAANGTLALLEGSADEQLVWVDRAGKRLGTVGQPGLWLSYELSPDEQHLVVERRDPQTLFSDLYVWDLARGTETRFTFDPTNDAFPEWSPDGNHIVWSSNREGVGNLYQKAASGAGQDEVLLQSAYRKVPNGWSADGKFLLYQETNPQTSLDLWVLPMEGERKPWLWLNTPFVETMGQFAPNGKWIAYTSNESGRFEIYVQTFTPGAPALGGKLQLSTNGGVVPQWRRDGRELFYRTLDGKLMAVEVMLGAEIKAGTPRELFSLGHPSGVEVAGDGQRFLMTTSATDTTVPPFTVVLNWMAEVKR